MRNTILTSVSALVFLVIGLLIGKSNKQIEFQTVVKTNIVEKQISDLTPREIYLWIITKSERVNSAEETPFFSDIDLTIGGSENIISNSQKIEIQKSIEEKFSLHGIKIKNGSVNNLIIDISSIESPDKSQIYYTIQVGLYQQSYVLDSTFEKHQISNACMWNHGSIGYYGKGYESKKVISESIDTSIEKFISASKRSARL